METNNEEFKGTKGYTSIDDLASSTQLAIIINGSAVAFIPRLSKNSEENSNLICEAFDVITRTGLTPEQMEKRIAVLEGHNQKNICCSCKKPLTAGAYPKWFCLRENCSEYLKPQINNP